MSYPSVLCSGAENSNVMFLAIPWPMLRTTILVVKRPVHSPRLLLICGRILVVAGLACLPALVEDPGRDEGGKRG